MFACPIVIKNEKTKLLEASDTIEYKAEVEKIKSEARRSKKNIVFRKNVAKLNTFDNMLALEPKILHISCKGFTTPEEALLFEKPGGEGIRVKKDDLFPLFKKKADKIQLMFLTSCTEEFSG